MRKKKVDNGKYPELTKFEMRIMKIIWDNKKPISVQEVMNTMNEKYEQNYARTTISTYAGHLVNKGYISSYRNGMVFYYEPVIDEKDYLAYINEEYAKFWYNGSIADMMSAICKNVKISDEDKKKLVELIEKLK